MKKGNVTADAINCDRQCTATDDEIRAFAESIRDTGLKNPVLVNEGTRTLIDGLTRVRAYQMLGWSVIPAILVSTVAEAADILEKIRQGVPVSYARTMEIFKDFKVLSQQQDAKRRIGVPRGGKFHYAPMEGAREGAVRACGVSQNAIARIGVLTKMALAGNKEAQHIVTNIFASSPGSPIVGFNRVTTLSKAQREMQDMPIDERVRALNNIVQATETSLDQIQRVGGLHILPHEDAEKIFARLYGIARTARSLYGEIRRSTQ